MAKTSSVKAFLYDADGEDQEIDIRETRLETLKENQLLWVEVTGRGADASENTRTCLKSIIPIDEDALDDLFNGNDTPAPNNYGEMFHATVKALNESHRSDKASKERKRPVLPELVRLDLVVGHNWLVTVSDGPLLFLEEFRHRDRDETVIGKLSSATLAASLLDWHLTAYLAGLEDLEDWLDHLDMRLLAGRAVTDKSLLKDIMSARQFVARMRRNLAPQRAVFYGLARPDFAPVADSDAQEAFKALERRYDRVLDSVEHGRELVQGSFDLFTTRIAESTNLLIRRLTFLSLMLGGIGAVAGIFGMNFQTSYTASGEQGFWMVISILGFLIIAATVVSLRKKWI
jgi:magnesium transporter